MRKYLLLVSNESMLAEIGNFSPFHILQIRQISPKAPLVEAIPGSMDGAWGMILLGDVLESLEKLGLVKARRPTFAILMQIVVHRVLIISIMDEVLDHVFRLFIFLVDMGVVAE